ncbi:hypothetical protein ACQ5SO_14500 [Rhodovulum sp. DZ06]|uniref:hypothetical protein n=1 Tax=Rhodovulum sp. DZ06 TaxID=3425126 RepID=UPI003D346B5D
MLTTSDHSGAEALRKMTESHDERLALARMLLWAEREAASLGAADAAGCIRKAISALGAD